MQFSLLIYIVVIFAVMYFLMIRPQQKRAKQHRELINNIHLVKELQLLVVLKVLLKQ